MNREQALTRRVFHRRQVKFFLDNVNFSECSCRELFEKFSDSKIYARVGPKRFSRLAFDYMKQSARFKCVGKNDIGLVWSTTSKNKVKFGGKKYDKRV